MFLNGSNDRCLPRSRDGDSDCSESSGGPSRSERLLGIQCINFGPGSKISDRGSSSPAPISTSRPREAPPEPPPPAALERDPARIGRRGPSGWSQIALITPCGRPVSNVHSHGKLSWYSSAYSHTAWNANSCGDSNRDLPPFEWISGTEVAVRFTDAPKPRRYTSARLFRDGLRLSLSHSRYPGGYEMFAKL